MHQQELVNRLVVFCVCSDEHYELRFEFWFEISILIIATPFPKKDISFKCLTLKFVQIIRLQNVGWKSVLSKEILFFCVFIWENMTYYFKQMPEPYFPRLEFLIRMKIGWETWLQEGLSVFWSAVLTLHFWWQIAKIVNGIEIPNRFTKTKKHLKHFRKKKFENRNS